MSCACSEPEQSVQLAVDRVHPVIDGLGLRVGLVHAAVAGPCGLDGGVDVLVVPGGDGAEQRRRPAPGSRSRRARARAGR